MPNNSSENIYRDKDGNFIITEEQMVDILDFIDALYESKVEKRNLQNPLEFLSAFPRIQRKYCCYAKYRSSNTVHDKKPILALWKGSADIQCEDWVGNLNISNPDLQVWDDCFTGDC
ncbi:hypothetical protein [Priestia megaterium]|uniref:hypothetical protein n=1 Tax=Priestia megaterium TaxID=1404 RepID=UPI00234EF355|nr:hypothetical protein [Priestia megaterium]MDC7783213.1 hypothetical protein [Priestia megaterium]